MGIEDKFENAKEEHLGEAKEQFGKLTGDEDTEAEGKADQVKANLKKAGEKIKNAFKK